MMSLESIQASSRRAARRSAARGITPAIFEKEDIAEAKAARKADLDAEPRCEVARCHRRGAWKLGGVLLCGGHTKRAKAGHAKVAASMGGLALFIPVDYDRTSILFWASGQED